MICEYCKQEFPPSADTESTICSNALCIARAKLVYYEHKFNEMSYEITALKSAGMDLLSQHLKVVDEFRIVGFGSEVDVSQLTQEEAYRRMVCARKVMDFYSTWLNQKHNNRIHIKKDQIATTQRKMKEAQNLLDEPRKTRSVKPIKVSKRDLNQFEQMTLDNMKFGMTQDQAEHVVRSMGAEGTARNLKELGVI